jgi:hypothetical protein
MDDNSEDVVDNLDTPLGKEILGCLLDKTGTEIAELLGSSTLEEFIDARCELYLDTLSSYLTSESFHQGYMGYTGAEEVARSEGFQGL